MKIKNRESLLSAGDIKTRKIVLDILEGSLRTLDTYHIILGLLNLDGHFLSIGEHFWDLDSKKRIFVIGAGKACNSMARAVEKVLGDRISNGLVIVKKIETGDRLYKIELSEGGHPLPNREGLDASNRILDMVDQATPDDLFVSVISGGSSALMACPVPGITLDDEIDITNRLLKSGARISEINAVRRHISNTNGGRLAQRVEETGAEMINLVVSDVVGDRYRTAPIKTVEYFGTPVAPDNTTLQDAIEVLMKYDLFSEAPDSIIDYLTTKNKSHETPKMFGERISHFVIQETADASEAAYKVSLDCGLPAHIITTVLEGEAREAGIFLASIAKEIYSRQRPFNPPCVLIAGGENTARVVGESGLGGPSQELSLSFASEIADMPGCCLAAVDTDGTDGPTEVAGGLVDFTTVNRAREIGMDVPDMLKAHDSYSVFSDLGDAIITGNTGTNVCDLNVIYIDR